MSRITTYPIISTVAQDDLLVISDVSSPTFPTKSVTVQQLVGGSTAPLALTTLGTSGPATLINNVLNVPQYSGGGGGMTQWFVDDGGAGGFPVTNNDSVAVNGSSKVLVATSAINKSITWTHASTARTDTTSAVSPGSGGTFTVVDSITQDATGHPTAVNVKTVTMPTGSGSGGVTSVTGQDGIVMTGTATDPVVNVDYLGADNYILTAATLDPLVPASRASSMNFSTERVTNQVYHTTLADIVDTGNGYQMTAFRLDVASVGATPTITMISNPIGGTWSITRLGVGEYTIANSNGGIFTDNTICYINNPNIVGTVGAATNVFPQATTIRRKTSTLISIECFEAGTSGSSRGNSDDLGIANPIYVEIKIYA